MACVVWCAMLLLMLLLLAVGLDVVVVGVVDVVIDVVAVVAVGMLLLFLLLWVFCIIARKKVCVIMDAQVAASILSENFRVPVSSLYSISICHLVRPPAEAHKF